MNKEVLLVATGIGIGALAFTENGRKLMNTLGGSGNSFLPSLGESKSDREHHKSLEEDKTKQEGIHEQREQHEGNLSHPIKSEE